MPIKTTFDSLTPGLKKLAAFGQSPKPVLEVMGVELKNVTIESFSDPSIRPAPWADKKDGGPSNLTDSTTLSKSFRETATNKKATVSTDRVYAAVHQFGSKDGRIPARPFFPFVNDTMVPAAHARIEAIGQLKLDNLLRKIR